MPKHRHSRMPPPLLILQMILAIALASGSMLAATVDAPEEDPAPEESQTIDPHSEKRSERAENFKSRFLLSRKAVEAGYSAEAKLRTERMENRRDCRESMRKANRDQRFAKLVTCMHDDLTHTTDMLKARSQAIIAAPGVTEELRELIIARSELLRDAMSTIIDGLDAGVYESEEGLHEARKNLREKYLLPYWSLLPRMQAEQTLAWISHLLLRSQSLSASQTLSTEVTAKLDEAGICLRDAETRLEEALTEKDSQKMNTSISQVQSTLVPCIGKYREAMSIQEGAK